MMMIGLNIYPGETTTLTRRRVYDASLHICLAPINSSELLLLHNQLYSSGQKTPKTNGVAQRKRKHVPNEKNLNYYADQHTHMPVF